MFVSLTIEIKIFFFQWFPGLPSQSRLRPCSGPRAVWQEEANNFIDFTDNQTFIAYRSRDHDIEFACLEFLNCPKEMIST